MAAAKEQELFFKNVDAYKLEETEEYAPTGSNGAPQRPPDTHMSSWDMALSSAVKRLPAIIPSRTVVMEAAFHLIRSGIFTIPDVGSINVKASRAFLVMAVWLQRYMLREWYENNKLDSTTVKEDERHLEEFLFAIIGPGGTGKTTILKSIEALVDFFLGSESVRKCAISNAAARLLRGDTLHALCKLPIAELQQRRGRLSTPVLKRHRERWRTAHAAFIDEISMVASDQLLQADVRTRQAKMVFDLRFGGLGMVFSGDFLQLPPVDKQSLAQPITHNGTYEALGNEDGDAGVDAGNANHDGEEKARAVGEARQGFELWRRF